MNYQVFAATPHNKDGLPIAVTQYIIRPDLFSDEPGTSGTEPMGELVLHRTCLTPPLPMNTAVKICNALTAHTRTTRIRNATTTTK